MPDMIKVSPAPPQKGAPLTYYEVTFEAFAAQQGFRVEHGLPASGGGASHYKTFVEMQIAKYEAQCVLVPMLSPPGHEDLSLGYAVHCIERRIPDGAIVTHYAGNLCQEDASKKVDETYCFSIIGSADWFIDAREAGNIARFFSHLLTSLEVRVFEIMPMMRGNIATQNLRPLPYDQESEVEKGILLMADRQIEPNEMMGFSYGLDYFLIRGILPFLYTREGFPLPTEAVSLDKERYILFQLLTPIIEVTLRFTHDPHFPTGDKAPLTEFTEALYDSVFCSFERYKNTLNRKFQKIGARLRAYFADEKQGLSLQEFALLETLLGSEKNTSNTEAVARFNAQYPLLAQAPDRFTVAHTRQTPIVLEVEVPREVAHVSSPLSANRTRNGDGAVGTNFPRYQ